MLGFLEALKAEIADLERQLEATPTYVKLREVRRLLALYATADVKPSLTDLTAFLAHEPPVPAVNKVRQFSGNSAAALEIAKGLIVSLARPVKTTEIVDALVKAGVMFGGKAPQNTLSSIMSKSGEFVAHRGIGWALTAPENESAGDALPLPGTPPAISERQVDFLAEPRAEGREAGPGGGT